MVKSFQFLNQTQSPLVFRMFGQPFGSQTLLAALDELIVLAISGRKRSHCCLSEPALSSWIWWHCVQTALLFFCLVFLQCKTILQQLQNAFLLLVERFLRKKERERESCEEKETINMTCVLSLSSQSLTFVDCIPIGLLREHLRKPSPWSYLSLHSIKLDQTMLIQLMTALKVCLSVQ